MLFHGSTMIACFNRQTKIISWHFWCQLHAYFIIAIGCHRNAKITRKRIRNGSTNRAS